MTTKLQRREKETADGKEEAGTGNSVASHEDLIKLKNNCVKLESSHVCRTGYKTDHKYRLSLLRIQSLAQMPYAYTEVQGFGKNFLPGSYRGINPSLCFAVAGDRTSLIHFIRVWLEITSVVAKFCGFVISFIKLWRFFQRLTIWIPLINHSSKVLVKWFLSP